MPYTYKTLVQMLETLCGADGYSLALENNAYVLTVRVDLIVKNQFAAVDELLERITPANTIIDLSLLYNNHIILSGYTHAELAAWTHEQLREDVL